MTRIEKVKAPDASRDLHGPSAAATTGVETNRARRKVGPREKPKILIKQPLTLGNFEIVGALRKCRPFVPKPRRYSWICIAHYQPLVSRGEGSPPMQSKSTEQFYGDRGR